MPEVGTAYVQIVPSAKGISGAISKELGGEASKAGELAGSNIAGKLVKVLGGALTALGIKQIISDSLDAGGAIQQSFGGLDTIYGDAADQAKKFAMEASRAGISANDYAEQAVSFGASLKQAFGGDTEKAVQAANTAIMDMTDNAAKMGTPIESIQAAYQGFAKQNYTLLDNLKIGYGGTKTEMERLLKDAQKISGVKYDISNLGDVYDAIHVIQGELGLTGVAADEASSTFTGSLGAMKASLQNFLASLSTGMDITTPLNDLIQSAVTFVLKNLLPMVTNIIMAIPSVAQTAFQTIVPMLGQAWSTLIAKTPHFIESGKKVILSLINGVISNLPQLISTAGRLVTQFVQYVLTNLPTIIQAGANIIMAIVSGIANNLPQIISSARIVLSNFLSMLARNLPTVLQTGVQVLLSLVTGILNTLPRIITVAGQAMRQFVSGIINNLPQILSQGMQIIANLVSGIIRAIPQIRSGVSNCVSAIREQFSNIDWWGIGSNIISGIARGISNGVGSIISAARSAAQSAFNAAKSKLEIGSPSKLFARGIGRWIPEGIAVGIEKNIGTIEDAMNDLSGVTVSAYANDLGSDRYSLASGSADMSGVVFNQTVINNSPQALNPSEIARMTRNSTQQMILSMNGV